MPAPEYQIDFAADYPHFIERIAPWHHAQWRHLNGEEDRIGARVARYRRECHRDRIPLLLVAHDTEQVMGSVRLVQCDMDTHPELGPWLASLYVHPSFRRRGIASALIERAAALAQELAYPALYLFTEDGEAFYRRRGWALRAYEHYRGKPVSIMQRELAVPEPA